jgi:glycosyltransferase involved in cell wall biosynthesis
MRILHAVLSEGFYGSERYCGELASEQARQGHDVEVLTLGARSSCTQSMRGLFAQTRPRADGKLRLAAIPRGLPAFLHRPLAHFFLQRFRPRIVHTHLDPAARRVGQIAQRLGIPHVATLHLNFSAPEYGACAGLVLIADWQRKHLPANFAGEVAVIRNWLPATVADALTTAPVREAVADLRRNWRAGDHTFVYGSVGRLVPEKGMDVLIQAFRAAFPQGDDSVRLVIVGDGPQRDALRAAVAGDDRIVLAGAQDEVAQFYLAFDCYVSAARFEPFGIAILEAMAAGCPLVLTRSQGPVEFVADPRVAWVDEGADSALADALVAMQENGRRRLGYALDEFSPQRATGEIERFYARVLANAQRSKL